MLACEGGEEGAKARSDREALGHHLGKGLRLKGDDEIQVGVLVHRIGDPGPARSHADHSAIGLEVRESSFDERGVRKRNGHAIPVAQPRDGGLSGRKAPALRRPGTQGREAILAPVRAGGGFSTVTRGQVAPSNVQVSFRSLWRAKTRLENERAARSAAQR